MAKRRLGKKLEIIQVLERNGYIRDNESIEKYEDGTTDLVTVRGANDRSKYISFNLVGKVIHAHDKNTHLREINYLLCECLTEAYKEDKKTKRGKNNGKN